MLADILPIMIFVFSYFYIALKMLLTYSNVRACVGIIMLFLASAATSLLPSEFSFNGSVSYFPCLLALLFLAWKSNAKMLYFAAIVFFFSLTFRSMDMAVCSQLALGTHFLWHILNGLLLYLLVKVLIIDCTVTKRM
jgi:hypothetical protein